MTAQAPVKLTLHRKLAQVMAEVERIPKRGRAPAAMGGFEFVQVGDAADAIRKGLSARSVSMLPSNVEIMNESEHATKSGGTMTTQTLRTTWTLTDGETGETAQIQSLGTGADTGDKFSPKAQTNSMKYALLMGFLLSTGEDPELSDSSDRRARPQRVEAIAAEVMERNGFTPRPVGPSPETSGLIGTAEQGKPNSRADFELRTVKEDAYPEPHPLLAFRLTEGRKGWKVYARGMLAELVAEHRPAIEGQRVTCWGSFSDESFPKDGKTIVYQVLNLTRLKVGVLDLSAPEPDDDDRLTEEDEAGLDQLVLLGSAS